MEKKARNNILICSKKLNNIELLADCSEVRLAKSGISCFRYDLEKLSDSVFKECELTTRESARADERLSFAFVQKNPKISAIFFDMDATVIKEESIVELARYAGKKDRVEQITEKAMRGEIEFEPALRERVKVLKGISQDVFSEVFARLTLQPNVAQLISELKLINIPAFLVSGGFMQLANPLKDRLGMVEARANTLEVKAGLLTGALEGSIIGAREKKQYVQETCRKFNFDRSQTVAVGDGANDIDMLSYVNISVGYDPKPVLIDHVCILNRTGDHRFLLDVLSCE